MQKITWSFVSLVLLVIQPSFAFDVSYDLEIKSRYFPDQSTDGSNNKFDQNIVAGLEIEFSGKSEDGNTIFNFIPFARWDSRDEERRHGDIRELSVIRVNGNWEFLAGISKVFWGVAESNHLVDIINQTDFLEGFDGEDKLGQPMLRLSRTFEQSTLTGFVLPGFREREFLGADNPLSLPFNVADTAIYESDDEEDHVDFALRFSGYHNILDYGFSYFNGTSRDPILQPTPTEGIFSAFYPQIERFSLDLQLTADAWLWKLEALNQSSVVENYSAAVGGLEYSFYGLQDGLYDLGLLLEQHYDSRGNASQTLFQNDTFVGMRFGFNDAASSSILGGAIIDLDDQSTSFRVEASRRIFNDTLLSIEAQAFSNIDSQNASFSLRNSDFILLSLNFFF